MIGIQSAQMTVIPDLKVKNILRETWKGAWGMESSRKLKGNGSYYNP